MKAFFERVKEQKRGSIGWLVLWLLGCAAFWMIGRPQLAGLMEEMSYHGKKVADTIVMGFVFVFATQMFMYRYMSIFPMWVSEQKRNAGAETGDGTDLYKFVQVHSFDAGQYCKLMCRSLIPVQVITAAGFIIYALCGRQSFWVTTVGVATVVLMPPVVAFGLYLLLRRGHAMQKVPAIANAIGTTAAFFACAMAVFKTSEYVCKCLGVITKEYIINPTGFETGDMAVTAGVLLMLLAVTFVCRNWWESLGRRLLIVLRLVLAIAAIGCSALSYLWR